MALPAVCSLFVYAQRHRLHELCETYLATEIAQLTQILEQVGKIECEAASVGGDSQLTLASLASAIDSKRNSPLRPVLTPSVLCSPDWLLWKSILSVPRGSVDSVS